MPDPTPEPTADATDAATEAEPAAESIAEPATEVPATEPTTESAAESAAEPTAEVPTAESAAEPAAESASGSAGVEPTVWSWLGRHRKRVAVVAGLVVAALVGTLVLVSVLGPGPVDVVEDYLDAIHAGDTDAALEIAGEPDVAERLQFLSAEALADDWTVENVVERHRGEDFADVDVTIRAGDTSEQGRFHLVLADDVWTMESPFVRVDLTAANLDFVELGGLRHDATAVGPGYEQAGVVPLLVFPGAYELYPGLADRLTFDPGVLVAAPQESPDQTHRVELSPALTDAGAESAQRAVDAYIDTCAKSPDASPDGCPFDAEYSGAIDGLTGLTGVTWTIVTHPEAHFVTAADGLNAVVRTPGTVRLTGSGVPVSLDGPRTTFATTCEFGLTTLAMRPTSDGFTVLGSTASPFDASSATLCY